MGSGALAGFGTLVGLFCLGAPVWLAVGATPMVGVVIAMVVARRTLRLERCRGETG
jgi:heme exporter protein D